MPRRYFFLWLPIVIALGAIAVTRISFNVDPLDVLPDDARGVKGLRVFADQFSGKGELIITLDGGMVEVSSEAQSLADYLTKSEELVSWVEWQPLWQEDPETASQLPAYAWFNGSLQDLVRLTDQLSPERISNTIDDVLEKLRFGLDGEVLAMAAYDPFGLLRPSGFSSGGGNDAGIFSGGKYASMDGDFRAIYVGAPREGMNYNEASTWVNRVRSVVEQWRKDNKVSEELQIGFTGEPAFSAEIGSGMQRDMSGSVFAALALIHIVFWFFHRRLLPLAAIFFTLVMILSVTVIIGSLVLGRISVMSVGFAAILIGLAVDYGVVLYQQSRQQAGTFRAVYASVGKGILWAAMTTAVVFASLSFSVLPGIRELGILVALGVVIGAGFMLLVFGPLAAVLGRENTMDLPVTHGAGKRGYGRGALPVTLTLCVGLVVLLSFEGFPVFYKGIDVLRPVNTPADIAFSRMSKKLSLQEELSLPVVLVADSLEGLGERATRVEQLAEKLRGEGIVTSSVFSSAMIPSVNRQRQNIPLIRELLEDEARLRAALDKEFTEDAQQILVSVFSSWRAFLENDTLPVRPHGDAINRVWRELVSEAGHRPAAMGLVQVKEGKLGNLQEALAVDEGVYLTGWQTMGSTIQVLVKRDLYLVFTPMVLLLFGMLYVVFRNVGEVVLGVGVLLLSALGLLAVMAIAGWQWNVLNICAFPLLIGTGIDYTIHMIGALRLHNGARDPVRFGIGRALLFCGISTAIGFGSLSLAGNVGLASLGKVCATGIIVTMTVAVFLLPGWWRFAKKVS